MAAFGAVLGVAHVMAAFGLASAAETVPGVAPVVAVLGLAFGLGVAGLGEAGGGTLALALHGALGGIWLEALASGPAKARDLEGDLQGGDALDLLGDPPNSPVFPGGTHGLPCWGVATDMAGAAFFGGEAFGITPVAAVLDLAALHQQCAPRIYVVPSYMCQPDL